MVFLFPFVFPLNASEPPLYVFFLFYVDPVLIAQILLTEITFKFFKVTPNKLVIFPELFNASINKNSISVLSND